MAIDSKFQMKSSDNEIFDVEEYVIREAHVLKNLILDMGTSNAGISVPVNVRGKILTKVLHYCKYHADSRESSDGKPAVPKEEIKQWDAQFFKVDHSTMFDLLIAANNYLNIPSLLDLTCQTIADRMKGKTTEELRDMFHVPNE